MVTVTKKFEFEACHHLPFYKGACSRLHGHSYKLEVTGSGSVSKDETDPKCGMIMDFKDLKALVKEEVIDKYDHKDLNEFFDNPTAEIMVKQMAVDIMSKLPKGVFLVSCKLWETSTSYAEWNVSLDTLKDIIYEQIGAGKYADNPTLMPGA